MRICVLTETYPVVSETFVWEPVRWLEERGCQVSVLAEHEGKSLDAPNGAELPEGASLSLGRRLSGLAGSPLRALSMLSEARRWRRPRPLDSLSRAVDRSLREADVLLAHFGPVGVRWLPAAAAAGRPLAVFFHGYDATELVDRSPHLYDELFASNVGLATNSEYIKRRLVQAGARAASIRIVPLSTSSAIWQSASDPVRSPRRLLCIARLVPKKGVDDALRAFATCEPSFAEPWAFEIVGDGPMRAELTALAESLGIAAKVRFLGACGRQDVLEALRRASLFVLASKTSPSGDTEGTPVSIIEAAALGCPVLSTEHAGIPELLPEAARERGFLVPEGDSGALASALAELAADDALRNDWAMACRAFVRTRHSPEAHVKALLAALGSAAGVPAKPS